MTLIQRDREMRTEGRIQQAVKSGIMYHQTEDAILIYLQKEFTLSKDEAQEYYDKYAGILV